MVDLQEMLVWGSLNWWIARKDEIGELYNRAILDYSFRADCTWNACVERLLTRGLLVSGSGVTDHNALYDLLNTMYIIPASDSFPLRLFPFLKLVLVRDVSLSMTRRPLCEDKRIAGEKQVICLAGRTLMLTAEIIKYVEEGVHSLPSGGSVLGKLYDDRDTINSSITCLVKSSPDNKPVALAVASPYLRKQIIFERI